MIIFQHKIQTTKKKKRANVFEVIVNRKAYGANKKLVHLGVIEANNSYNNIIKPFLFLVPSFHNDSSCPCETHGEKPSNFLIRFYLTRDAPM